ncbi:beta-ketoacyl-ACP synthase III [Anaerotignum sp.]
MSFRVLGTGMYVPPKVVTNDDLSQFLDTNDAWIQQRVGVRERHISTSETAADMAAKAALAALENSGVAPEEIDLILAATVSGESISPSVSCMVQKLLGLSCMAMDINAACSAFDFLLETAAGFFARGKAKKVLVIGAERMSRILDWEDRSTCVIFGDGAGAAVLGTGENYIDAVFDVKGGDDVIDIRQPVGSSPFYERGQEKKAVAHMAGQETFKFAVTAICRDCREILQRNGLTFEDIAYIVPHQANQRIIDYAISRLPLAPEKYLGNIAYRGNTSAAAIPILLDEFAKKGQFKKGDILAFSSFGAGLTSAAALLEWEKEQ